MAQSGRFIRFVRLPLSDKYAAIRAILRDPRLLLGDPWTAGVRYKLCVDPPEAPAVARPAPFILVASDHGTMIVNRNDFAGFGPFGFGVGHQILNTCSFNREEVELARVILAERKKTHGPGVVAIDCGANIGVHTVEWARLMTGWGTVIAIEAQERVFYSLCGNITINNCLNARAIWGAVGAAPGTMRIPTPDYTKPASFGSLELRETDHPEEIGQKINYNDAFCSDVAIISIDGFSLGRVDFIKIDVEGMEMEVLMGANNTISSQKPIIMVEVIKSDRNQIRSFLQECGYVRYRIAENVLAIHESDPAATALSSVGGRMRIEAA